MMPGHYGTLPAALAYHEAMRHGLWPVWDAKRTDALAVVTDESRILEHDCNGAAYFSPSTGHHFFTGGTVSRAAIDPCFAQAVQSHDSASSSSKRRPSRIHRKHVSLAEPPPFDAVV
jgi:hypothetical protein